MQESKPWYKSLTIIGVVVSAITGILGIFHVNIVDLGADLTNGLLGFGLLVGTVITIIGRCRASKNITLGNTNNAASLVLLCLLSGALFFGLTGCGSAGSTTTASSTGTNATTESSTVNGWKKFLTALKSAVHTGLSAMQTAANALYTITKDITPDELSVYLTTFGVDQATITDVVSAYKQAGASAAAASRIAATIDGATVASQSAQ